MSLADAAALVVSVALMAYLLVALINPERF